MTPTEINPGKVEEDKKFNLGAWLSQHSSVISFVISLLTVLAFFWAIHSEISALNSRIGYVEGELNVIIQEKNNPQQTIVYPTTTFTPTPALKTIK